MLESCITSFVDGRVRVRHPALHLEKNTAPLREVLGVLPGVHKVTINSRTGSLLLEYDPTILSKEDLLSFARQWEPFDTPVKPSPQKKRILGITKAQAIHYTNRGMLLSLVASLGFAAMGRERGHIVAGGIFLFLNALHLHTFRRCL